eukprot:CAMPEP_0184360196 /NCGR_PEP_ID=MMETSP1089-20130417/123806_1 /TAXON_ID=38269 ORGANISM="Gloeochaete wittrockiana, Strain SAG46.84" /NCGR_SAMPLE_ID=MMETSP1089 /ASSEMBLY_ACC=CAM_ASM_000445 /LENGTH=314 /DNA_ID=CAMNT_0026699297 /DNA_START=25 /DNA_END=965 /DNA_ORIENTATION=+
MQVPVTVFTGYLGAGKTTIILNVIKEVSADYKIVWLKNEIGDVAVDSLVAKQNNIQAQEMVAGCICCVLIGQLENALADIVSQYSPDRVIVETSGSAQPAPIAWGIKRREDIVKLDGIVNVVDCLNFERIKDKSYTAKLQAQYTDLILLNKHQLVSESVLDRVLDDIYELNPDTPKIKTLGHGKVSPDLIFGLDSKLVQVSNTVVPDNHQELEVDLIEIIRPLDSHPDNYDPEEISIFLKTLPSDAFIRIKGIFSLLRPPAELVPTTNDNQESKNSNHTSSPNTNPSPTPNTNPNPSPNTNPNTIPSPNPSPNT